MKDGLKFRQVFGGDGGRRPMIDYGDGVGAGEGAGLGEPAGHSEPARQRGADDGMADCVALSRVRVRRKVRPQCGQI